MKNSFLLFTFCFSLALLKAQQKTGLILQSDLSKDGYVLFAPLHSKDTYLIDKCGRVVHKWHSKYKPGQSVYLLANGKLLRTANASDTSGSATGEGKIEMLDWLGKVVWSVTIDNEKEKRHHDICPLPNGNILVLAWDKKTKEEALQKGRDPKFTGEELWSEKVMEIKPVGAHAFKVVWEWKVWDHLIQDRDPALPGFGEVSQNPELVNLNHLESPVPDWLHFNAIDYNAKLDQIIISNRNFSEIFILDHSTTTLEASTHKGGKQDKGGDLLYRWGNPNAYHLGEKEEQTLFSQHNAQWIREGFPDEGKILVFNNGLNRLEGKFSSVEIFSPPKTEQGGYLRHTNTPFLPTTSEWKYTDPDPSKFYSYNISGAQRLLNGNTLICEGSTGTFFEIDKTNTIMWKYVNPVNMHGVIQKGDSIFQNQVFRCTFYEKNYSAFKGRLLKPGNTIELQSPLYECGKEIQNPKK